MAEHNFRKRIKYCTITVKVVNSQAGKVSDFEDIKAGTIFNGTKNEVIHKLKLYLKSIGIVGSDLSNIMIKANASTDVYNKDLVPFKPYRVDIVNFDEKTNLVYFITVKYYVTKIRKVPFKWSVNLKGENIYEKRLLQDIKNSLDKRLEVANKAIKEIKLEEAIYKPFIEQVFKNVSNNKEDRAIPFSPPYETVIVVAPDIEALVRWEVVYDTDIRIKLKVKSILYRGKEIRLEPPNTELSESNVASVEYLAKELTEVYNSIKGQTEDNKNTSRGVKTE
jgi:hypothetical protein